MPLEWTEKVRTLLNGVPVDVISSNYSAHETSDDRIVVLRPKAYFDSYSRLFSPFSSQQISIVELGIFEGGSSLVFAEMLPSARIAAFDLRDENSAVLRHVARMGFSDRVRLCYRVSQSDYNALHEQLIDFFGNGPLDIVMDDASHHCEHTRNPFEILFPLLRPGGLYIIEDWAWAHWSNPTYDSWKGTSLSSLVLELVMALASAPQQLAEIIVRPGWVAIAKSGPFSRERMSVDSLIKLCPRSWQPLRLD